MVSSKEDIKTKLDFTLVLCGLHSNFNHVIPTLKYYGYKTKIIIRIIQTFPTHRATLLCIYTGYWNH